MVHVDRWGDVQMSIDQQDEYVFERIEALDNHFGSLYTLKLTTMRSSDDLDLDRLRDRLNCDTSSGRS
jgi:hypothetical protein